MAQSNEMILLLFQILRIGDVLQVNKTNILVHCVWQFLNLVVHMAYVLT